MQDTLIHHVLSNRLIETQIDIENDIIQQRGPSHDNAKFTGNSAVSAVWELQY